MAKFRKCVVVLPARNEVEHIINVIDAALRDPRSDEVWVVDGCSTDGTYEAVSEYLSASPRLKLLRNPNARQAHGINLAASIAKERGFDAMVRMDCHAYYENNFVTQTVQALEMSEAASVVVPLISYAPASAQLWQRAAASLQNMWLGHGGSRHRKPGPSGWIEHGHHAAFDLEIFDKMCGYDANLSACEDVDYDHRLKKSGHRIWLTANATVLYIPRDSPRSYFAQMYRNGVARVAFNVKHKTYLGVRQIMPVFAIFGVFASLLLGLFVSTWLLGFAASYLIFVFWASAFSGRSQTIGHHLRVFILSVVSHSAFTLGVISGFLQKLFTNHEQAL